MAILGHYQLNWVRHFLGRINTIANYTNEHKFILTSYVSYKQQFFFILYKFPVQKFCRSVDLSPINMALTWPELDHTTTPGCLLWASLGCCFIADFGPPIRTRSDSQESFCFGWKAISRAEILVGRWSGEMWPR